MSRCWLFTYLSLFAALGGPALLIALFLLHFVVRAF